MTNNNSITAPLVGAALLTHQQVGRQAGLPVSEIALSAGYLRSGRVQFTAFYEALLEARESNDNPQGFRPWARNNRRPFALLVLTLPSGEPLSFASFPLEVDADNETTPEQWGEALEWLNDHRDAITQAAGCATVSATIRDRYGLQVLAKVDRYSVRLGDDFIKCDRCGAIEWRDDSHGVDGAQWCESCHDRYAQTCDCCGETFDASDLHRVAGGEDVCEFCRDDRYEFCNHCDEYQPRETFRSIYDGAGRRTGEACESCIDYNLERETWSIDGDGDVCNQPPRSEVAGMERHSYHTDPHDHLNTDPLDTGKAYGVEMEFLGSPTTGEALADACEGFAILTEDGTVDGELVTVAAGAGEIRRWLQRVTEALQGTRNTSEVGMHIHTDRRHLSPWQWYRLAHYCRTYATTLEAVGGRGETHYQGWRRLHAETWGDFAKTWKKYRDGGSRYYGMRLTPKTVEFRCCRATKDSTKALARFSLIRRLIALGKVADSCKPYTEQDLRGYLAQDPNIQAITGWKPGGYNLRDALKSAPEDRDMAPWQQPGSAQNARMLRIQAQVQRRVMEYLRQQERKADLIRCNQQLSRALRTQARYTSNRWEVQYWNERDKLARIEAQLLEIEPLEA